MKEVQGSSPLKEQPVMDRKKEIIKTATVLFYEQGYDNTPTRELARAADLSNAGIYYHFKDKEDILFHILFGSVTSLLDALVSAVNPENNPEQNLRQIIENLLLMVNNNRMEIGLLIKESQRLNREQIAIIDEKSNNALKLVLNEINRLKEQGKLKSVDPKVAAFSIIAMTNWSFYWYSPAGSLSIPEVADEMATLFFNGILK